MAWKLNSRCSRSSRNRRRMALPSRPKPPSRTSLRRDVRAGEQVERGVEVAVDEVRHLGHVQVLQPVHEAVEGGRVHRAAGVGDLVPHGLAAVADPDRGAVGELGPVGRVQPSHRQQLVQVRVDRAQGVGDQVPHGQHRRPGVEGEAVADQLPVPAAGDVLPLDHGHLVPASGQVAGGGQPGQSGSDDDDSHASVMRSGWPAAVRVFGPGSQGSASRQAIRWAITVSSRTPSGSARSCPARPARRRRGR